MQFATLAGKRFNLSFSKDNKLTKIIDSSYFRLLLNHIVMVEITLIFLDNCKHHDKQPPGLVEYFRLESVFHGLLITLKNKQLVSTYITVKKKNHHLTDREHIFFLFWWRATIVIKISSILVLKRILFEQLYVKIKAPKFYITRGTYLQ